MSSMTWRMPPPPPPHVLSIRDEDGVEWIWDDMDRMTWRDQDGYGQPRTWDWLLWNRGTLAAEELAA